MTRAATPNAPDIETRGVEIAGGRYLLGASIAEGGGATVVRAYDTRLQRVVAVKRPAAHDMQADGRLRGEAAVLARLSHPNVVRCLDLVADDHGTPCLVLSLADGANLAQHARLRPIEAGAARAWAADLCRAVAHVHARGIVHGDLKPQHLVIARTDGRGVLVDFDHAHDASMPGASASGAKAYTAPEVRAGAPTSIQSDRFALGAVLRWLVARAAPGAFDASARAVIDRLGDSEPARRADANATLRALASLPTPCEAGMRGGN